jgi:hypothetical protein
MLQNINDIINLLVSKIKSLNNNIIKLAVKNYGDALQYVQPVFTRQALESPLESVPIEKQTD